MGHIYDYENDELHAAYMEDVDEILAGLRVDLSDLISDLLDQVEDLGDDDDTDDDDNEYGA